MDLGAGVWPGRNRGLRALYLVRPALATAIGTGGIRRVEPAGLADLSRRFLERMAIHDHTSRGAGDADAGGDRRSVLPAANPPRFGAGLDVRGVLRAADAADGGDGSGDAQGPDRRSNLGGNDQRRYFPVW